jgi:hypothetical protein
VFAGFHFSKLAVVAADDEPIAGRDSSTRMCFALQPAGWRDPIHTHGPNLSISVLLHLHLNIIWIYDATCTASGYANCRSKMEAVSSFEKARKGQETVRSDCATSLAAASPTGEIKLCALGGPGLR